MRSSLQGEFKGCLGMKTKLGKQITESSYVNIVYTPEVDDFSMKYLEALALSLHNIMGYQKTIYWKSNK